MANSVTGNITNKGFKTVIISDMQLPAFIRNELLLGWSHHIMSMGPTLEEPA